MLTLLFARNVTTGAVLFAIGNTSSTNSQALANVYANGLKINSTNAYGSVEVTNTDGTVTNIFVVGMGFPL